MCTPETIIGGTLASGALSAMGQWQQGKAQSKVLNENARRFNQMAIDAERRGADAAYQSLLEGDRAVAAQEVAMAANNIDSSSGSMAQLLSNTAGASMFDALMAKNNADRAAYSNRVQEADARTQAKAAMTQGRNAVLGTLLTSGVAAGSAWYKMNQKKETADKIDNLFVPEAQSNSLKAWDPRNLEMGIWGNYPDYLSKEGLKRPDPYYYGMSMPKLWR